VADDGGEEKRKQRERDLAEHNRLMERSASHASRDVLHDSALETQPGEYTTLQARDRAAHTAAWVKTAEGLDSQASRFTPEERTLLAQQGRDMTELYPTEEALQRSYPATAPPPEGTDARRQYDDFRQMYPPEKTDADSQTQTKERSADMTPEQQASVDKALAQSQISRDVGGASDVSSKPQPNEPTPMEKARDIGQDLQKQGVTMDKE
jgi:hypothetical protein